jgi:hypothetical protein
MASRPNNSSRFILILALLMVLVVIAWMIAMHFFGPGPGFD